MSEQFKEQGGAATMDPSRFRRWVTSKIANRLVSGERTEKQRQVAERQRQKHSQPHVVEYFHQLDDGYSHLACQLLSRLRDRYDIELRCHLVHGTLGDNTPEPDLLSRLSRYDAFHIAPAYGLEFPNHPQPLDSDLVARAEAILAAQGDESFPECAMQVGRALWSGDAEQLTTLAQTFGEASPDAAQARVVEGDARRSALKHYSGAMFYYGGEWYWGVDRLYHLEQRLAALGADRHPQDELLAPRHAVDAGQKRDTGRLTFEIYPSLRSPYTAAVFDRAVALARDTGVKLVVRPVLPMVMRGVPATREKGFYVFWDAAREARAAGVPFGNFYDPIGNPARQAYSLYPWADEQGRGVELISSFLRHAFAEGVNTNKVAGLQKVVEAAGLDWNDALQQLGKPGWEAVLEENRLAMYEAGLWGVPSFRLLDATGEPVLALWGQDRLWLFAQAIRRELDKEPQS